MRILHFVFVRISITNTRKLASEFWNFNKFELVYFCIFSFLIVDNNKNKKNHISLYTTH